MEAEAPGILFTAVVFLFTISVLVFVHEMGHFLVARWCKVKVDVFSIGFGKELIGWDDKKGTRWRISAIPLGGYVKFFGDANGASAGDNEALNAMSEADKAISFHHQSVWKRAAIVFAGPFINFLFAVLIFASIVYVNGDRIITSEIGAMSESVAAQGLRVGDVVTSVEGRTVDRFDELSDVIGLYPDQTISLEVMRDGVPLVFSIKTSSEKFLDRFDNEHVLGMLVVKPTAKEPVIKRIIEGSAAHQYGLKGNDRIIAVAGAGVETFADLKNLISTMPNRDTNMTVERDGDFVELPIKIGARDVPQADGTVTQEGVLGVYPMNGEFQEFTLLGSLAEGTKTTVRYLKNFTTAIGQLILGLRSVKELAGPIGMAAMVGEVANIGFVAFLTFLALISINLGFVNLLPIPMLDGGHLMFYSIEAIKGSPLPKRAQELAFMAGFVIIIGLMIFVTLNDLHSIVL